MPRVVLLDDHPAVLAGLRSLIEREPDMCVAASTRDAKRLQSLLDAVPADVLVLDHDLAHDDGLAYCLRAKRRPDPPAVVVYAAYADPALALAARAAGADALVDKAEPIASLLRAVRAAAAGVRTLPATPLEAHAAGVARVDDEDLPILAMLLDGVKPDEIALAVQRDAEEIAWRAQRIVGRLCPGLRRRPAVEPPDAAHAAPSLAGDDRHG